MFGDQAEEAKRRAEAKRQEQQQKRAQALAAQQQAQQQKQQEQVDIHSWCMCSEVYAISRPASLHPFGIDSTAFRSFPYCCVSGKRSIGEEPSLSEI